MSKVTSRGAQNLGPYTADQFRSGDPYEVSRGRLIPCPPRGDAHARVIELAASTLETDPAVENAGVDSGLKLAHDTLRAVDVAVNYGEERPGWITVVPPLVVEYVPAHVNEAELRIKLDELMSAGVRHLWVAHLTAPRHVEVYERGELTRTALPGEMLRAPDVLQNPVPVEALYEREAAHEVALRNLLQRRGYRDLDAVRVAGQLDTLAHQFERKLKRSLTAAERVTLRGRITALGAERVSDVVLDYDGDPLAAWLASPDAR